MKDRLKDSNTWELLLWLLGQRCRFRVTGLSMFPLLKPGDKLLVDPNAYRQKLPCPGDIVVARHPYRPNLLLVKRVASVLEDGQCFLMGNNSSESTDSRSFGCVSPQQILGRVSCRFP